ncbi:DUF89 family protein [candidate division WOR-3 bacterium]|nr:DUF89 family protein [candidate division WOR-3 bacterium]
MLTRIECIPCILDDLVEATKILNLTEPITKRILDEALRYLSEGSKFKYVPTYHITKVHRILKRLSGIDIPFQNLRGSCNRVGIELASNLSGQVDKLSDLERFIMLVKWSIAGNLLDFRTVGAGYGLDISAIENMLNDNIKKGLYVDHTMMLYDLIKDGGKRVFYILDNVGEIALDRLLIGELVKLGNAVTASVRGGPITSDVTIKDANLIGLNLSGASIVVEDSDTLGFSWEDRTREISKLLGNVDIIIAKGQANFCVLSEHKDDLPLHVFSLFTTKCDFISNIFGGKNKINLAVKLGEL